MNTDRRRMLLLVAAALLAPTAARAATRPLVTVCHTAEVENYLLEGHVPATALIRLLAARPSVRGIAVAGMPVGSPGMDVAGMEPETYDVMAFGSATPSLFMRFRSASPIPN
ncbi:MAG: metal-binding protein [Rhizobiales bacterium 32-66-11]|nr:MAG: metal-binding protein [Rhizobiales bacterium 32-66-11]